MKSIAALLSLVLLLASCALFEPTASASFNAASGTSTETVFTCAETSISSLYKEDPKWQLAVTLRNLQGGLFETKNFKVANIEGVRTQIKYSATSSAGTIKIKSSGPYFVDLGAKHAATQLKIAIEQCVVLN